MFMKVFGFVLAAVVAGTSVAMITLEGLWQKIEASVYGGARRPAWFWAVLMIVVPLHTPSAPKAPDRLAYLGRRSADQGRPCLIADCRSHSFWGLWSGLRKRTGWIAGGCVLCTAIVGESQDCLRPFAATFVLVGGRVRRGSRHGRRGRSSSGARRG